MNRKGPWEGYRRQTVSARCLLPGFLCAHIFIERERKTSGYEAAFKWYGYNIELAEYVHRPWLIIMSGKFSHSKATDFLNFVSLYKCRKSVTKTTLISLNWEIMDQTMPRIILVSWRKLLGAREARYQQEFCRKFTPRDRTDVELFSMTNIRDIQNNWK